MSDPSRSVPTPATAAGSPSFPDAVFDPDAVLVRAPAEQARAERRLRAAVEEFARLGPPPGLPVRVPDTAPIAQVDRYACGPATAEMIIRHQGVTGRDGVAVGQAVLAGADQLAVAVHGGTRWIHDVMACTLRRWLPGGEHVATPGPSVDELRAIVAWSVRRSRWVAAEVRQVPGGPHLPGHPVDTELCHWFVIAGFATTVDTAVIVDPAASPAVAWADAVRPVARFPVATIAALAGHHGVVW